MRLTRNLKLSLRLLTRDWRAGELKLFAMALVIAVGAVTAGGALYAPDAVAQSVPAPGSAWVEARVLHALGAAVGDRIEIGNAEFTVTRVLTYEPGRGGNFFALAPRVLIHRSDVARTRVIQPGSRVTYGHAFAGAAAAVARLQRRLAP